MGEFWSPDDDWPELVAFIFLVIGLALALASRTLIIAYVVVFLMGLIWGRALYRFHKVGKTAIAMSILGCLVGFILGLILGNVQIVILCFLIGILVGWWVHQKNIVESIEF